jgi:hypothetical protein
MFGPSLGGLGSFMAFKNHCGNEKLVVYGMSRVRACTRKTEINSKFSLRGLNNDGTRRVSIMVQFTYISEPHHIRSSAVVEDEVALREVVRSNHP